MIVDGKAIVARIYNETQNIVSHMDVRPHLTIFTCAPNFETQKYLTLKRKTAHEIGIEVDVIEFPSDISTHDAILAIAHARKETDGIVVQLPLPSHIDTDAVQRAIPKNYDVDASWYDGSSDMILPPVVGAIGEIAKTYDVLWKDKKVVVVGNGRLVGKPSAVWVAKQGALVSMVTREGGNLADETKNADIIILGAGSPGILTKDMVKVGAVIFDAGTSEEGGKLVGDADAGCAEVASLFTPVPGGIGPLTIAKLFENVIILSSQHQ